MDVEGHIEGYKGSQIGNSSTQGEVLVFQPQILIKNESDLPMQLTVFKRNKAVILKNDF